MEYYYNAGPGIKKMYIASIGIVICLVASLLPFISIFAIVAMLVLAILNMIGLYQAGKYISGCRTAFILTIANIFVGIIEKFFEGTFLESIIGIGGAVLEILIVYYMCTSIAEVMNQIGADSVAQKGYTVWKITLVCNIVMIVFGVLVIIPGFQGIALIGILLSTIAMLVAAILQMTFLSQSAKALGA